MTARSYARLGATCGAVLVIACTALGVTQAADSRKATYVPTNPCAGPYAAPSCSTSTFMPPRVESLPLAPPEVDETPRRAGMPKVYGHKEWKL